MDEVPSDFRKNQSRPYGQANDMADTENRQNFEVELHDGLWLL